ncbi:MAG: NAD(P)-dependent glycerol-3-phosphate dehydrogenase, partial [Actinobacteria bacterium]
NVMASADIAQVVDGSKLIVLTLPTHAMRSVVKDLAGHLTLEMPIISLAKGLEVKSRLRMSEVVKQEIDEKFHNNVAILSGPNHAEEVAAKIPSATVIAAYDKDVARYLQSIFINSHFRVYINSDIVGVELGGATKNVVAIAAGISDGLGFGDNTKAALITRGLAEMTRLGVSRGADAKTFSGLSGLGDLVVTCTSKHSRNRGLGEALGKGETFEEFKAKSSMVAEGANCCLALKELSKEVGVEMPINDAIRQVIYEHRPPLECVQDLMNRGARGED